MLKNVCNASVESIDKFVLVAMLKASTRVSETVSFGSLGSKARNRFHILSELFPASCAQATPRVVLFSSLPFLVEFGLARPNREFFFGLQDFPRDAAEMFMNASLTLFFRQAAAQLSPLAPPPCRHGEFAQGAVDAVRLLFVPRFCDFGDANSSSVASARHHEKTTANSPIECTNSGSQTKTSRVRIKLCLSSAQATSIVHVDVRTSNTLRHTIELQCTQKKKKKTVANDAHSERTEEKPHNSKQLAQRTAVIDGTPRLWRDACAFTCFWTARKAGIADTESPNAAMPCDVICCCSCC